MKVRVNATRRDRYDHAHSASRNPSRWTTSTLPISRPYCTASGQTFITLNTAGCWSMVAGSSTSPTRAGARRTGTYPSPTPPRCCWAPARRLRRRRCASSPRPACWWAFAAAVVHPCSAPTRSMWRWPGCRLRANTAPLNTCKHGYDFGSTMICGWPPPSPSSRQGCSASANNGKRRHCATTVSRSKQSGWRICCNDPAARSNWRQTTPPCSPKKRA